MTITLTPADERIVDQAIRAGLIASPDAAVEVGLEALRTKLDAHEGSPQTANEWRAELHSWIVGHAGSTPFLSDEDMRRESVYRDLFSEGESL